MGSIPSEFTIYLFEATDQWQHLAPLDGAARRLAKMRSATERSGFIDQTLSRAWLKHGTGPIDRIREGFSTGGSKSLCGQQGFSPGQLGNFSGELKLAAFRPTQAVSVDGVLGKLRINGTHLRKECLMAFYDELAGAGPPRMEELGVRTWVGPAWP